MNLSMLRDSKTKLRRAADAGAPPRPGGDGVDAVVATLATLVLGRDDTTPLVRTSVQGEVRDYCSQLMITQTYVNAGREEVNAVYEFPIDSRAAVCGFESEVDGVVTRGCCMEKQEAQAGFDDAVSGGGSAQLLEQETADMFRMKVGRLRPNQQVIVRIQTVSVLRIVDKAVELFIPTHLAPRYDPHGAGTRPRLPSLAGPRSSKASQPLADPFTVSIDAHMSAPISSIACTTHRIERTTPYHRSDPTTANADPAPAPAPAPSPDASFRVVPDPAPSTTPSASFPTPPRPRHAAKDISVLITTTEPHQPRLLIERTPTSAAAVVTIAPQLEFEDVRSECIFMLDRSGSMRGKIQATRRAMTLFLRSLPEECKFNIVGFGSNHSSLFPHSVDLSAETLAAATQYVSSMDADMGGTEILPPMLQALAPEPVPGYPRQIFLLTDGQVYNTEEVVAAVAKASSTARCFSLALGHGASRDLVEGVARAGGGESDFVADGSGGNLERAVVQLLKRALQPALSDVRVDWGQSHTRPCIPLSAGQVAQGATRNLVMDELSAAAGGETETETDQGGQEASAAPRGAQSLLHHISTAVKERNRTPSVRQAPHKAAAVFSGSRHLTFGLADSPGALTQAVITALSPDGPLSVNVTPVVVDRESPGLVHALAARALIQDLQEGRSWLHQQQGKSGMVNDRVKSEMVALGTQYQLASKHTSFLATQPRRPRPERYMADSMMMQQQSLCMAGLGGGAPMSMGNPMSMSLGGARGGGMMLKKMSKAKPKKTKGMMPRFRSAAAAAPPPQTRSLKTMKRAPAAAPAPRRCASARRGSFETGGGGLQMLASLQVRSAAIVSDDDDDMSDSDDGSWDDSYRGVGCGGAAQPKNLRKERHSAARGRSAQNEPSDPVQRLAVLQTFDGSFDVTPELARAAHVSMDKIQALLGRLSAADKDENKDLQKCVGTALAVASFRGRLADRAGEWELIVQKALRWLRKHAKDVCVVPGTAGASPGGAGKAGDVEAILDLCVSVC